MTTGLSPSRPWLCRMTVCADHTIPLEGVRQVAAQVRADRYHLVFVQPPPAFATMKAQRWVGAGGTGAPLTEQEREWVSQVSQFVLEMPLDPTALQKPGPKKKGVK